MRLLLLSLGLIACGVVAYFAFLAAPDATIHLERARQLVTEESQRGAALVEAREHADRAITIARREGQTEILREGLLVRGVILQRLGSFSSALRDFQAVIALDPERDIETVFDIVDTLISAGRRYDKLESFDRAFEFLDSIAGQQGATDDQALSRLSAARAAAFEARAEARLRALRRDLTRIDSGPLLPRRIEAVEEYGTQLEEGAAQRAREGDLLQLLAALDAQTRESILEGARAVRADNQACLDQLRDSLAQRPRAQTAAKLLQELAESSRWRETLDIAALYRTEFVRERQGLNSGSPAFERILASQAGALVGLSREREGLALLEEYRVAEPGVAGRLLFLDLLDLLADLEERDLFLQRYEEAELAGLFQAEPLAARNRAYYEGLRAWFARDLDTAAERLGFYVDQAAPRNEPRRVPLALDRLGRIHEELRQPSEAERYLQRLLSLRKDKAGLLATMARRRHEALNDDEEASRLLLRAMQEDPALTPSLLPLWREIAQSFLDRAGIDLERAVSQAAKSTSLRSYLFDTSVLFLVAEEMLRQGRTVDALTILLNLSQLAPDFASVQLLRARAAAALDQPQRAIKTYQEYLARVPGDEGAWVELEELLQRSEESLTEGQVREIRFRAIRSTLSGRGRLELMQRLLARGQVDQALLLLSPERLPADQLEQLATHTAAALAAARPARALELLDTYLGPDPRENPTGHLLAIGLDAQVSRPSGSDPDRIAARIRKFRSVSDPPLPELRRTAGLLLDHGYAAETIALLEVVPATNGGRDSVWFGQMGLALAATRDWRRAELALDRALAIGDPDGIRAGMHLFAILHAQQRYAEALELVQLLELLPAAGQPEMREGLAVARALAGDVIGAERSLRQVAPADYPFGPAAWIVTRRALEALGPVPEAQVPAPEGDEASGDPESATSQEPAVGEDSDRPVLPPLSPTRQWIAELSPTDELLFLETVLLRQAGSRAERVKALCKHLVSHQPRSAVLLLFLAEAEQQLGNESAVLPIIQVALALEPELGPALKLLETTVRGLGDPEALWNVGAQRLAYLCGTETPDLDLILARGHEILSLGHPEAVLPALVALAPENREKPRLRALEARAWTASGQPDRALRLLRDEWIRLDAAQSTNLEAREVGREYLRALRLTDPPSWAELARITPRLTASFPNDPLIQVVAASVSARRLESGGTSKLPALDETSRLRDRIARGKELLLETPQSLFDDGEAQAHQILEVLADVDESFRSGVLWSEMTKNPERAELWMLHAASLERQGREEEVIEEYRMLSTFFPSAQALLGRARYVAQVSYLAEEFSRLQEEIVSIEPLVARADRPNLLAAKLWLASLSATLPVDWNGEVLQACEESPAVREALVRAALRDGSVEALRAARVAAVDAKGVPRIASPTLARCLATLVPQRRG